MNTPCLFKYLNCGWLNLLVSFKRCNVSWHSEVVPRTLWLTLSFHSLIVIHKFFNTALPVPFFPAFALTYSHAQLLQLCCVPACNYTSKNVTPIREVNLVVSILWNIGKSHYFANQFSQVEDCAHFACMRWNLAKVCRQKQMHLATYSILESKGNLITRQHSSPVLDFEYTHST